MVGSPGDVIRGGNVILFGSMEVLENKGRAAGACMLMGFGYVALLYAPVLCLPQPKSPQAYMLRRFACSAVASVLAPFICIMILPVRKLALLLLLNLSFFFFKPLR